MLANRNEESELLVSLNVVGTVRGITKLGSDQLTNWDEKLRTGQSSCKSNFLGSARTLAHERTNLPAIRV